jgi:hypothetical protein
MTVLTRDEQDKLKLKNLGFIELGVAGAKISDGFVFEDFLKQLQLEKGQRIYREMRDNDATINAVIFAVEMILRAVNWTVEENSQTKGTREAEDSAIFLEGALFDDMSHTFDDFISEVLSMLTFGWQYTEIVYKRRLGPTQLDPSRRSIYDDGAIGIRKLANRAQETLYKWNIDETGGVKGLWQDPPFGGFRRYIPIEKSLLFRPHPQKGSPEGRSALRGAYRSWAILKTIQENEAIAIERELNGLPVISIPNQILNSDDPLDIAARNEYIKMGRDVKFNSQGAILIPSNTYFDSDGNPTNIRTVDFRLAASEGTRNIDVGSVILRYQRDIARTILADFIMLGSTDRGSFALSKDKSNLFIKALEGWNEAIAETLNRYLIPRLWRMNNFDRQYMPYLRPGAVAPVDLDSVGQFISDLSRAGAPLFPDDELENTLRAAADLPEKDPTMAQEDNPTLVSPQDEGSLRSMEEMDMA